MSQLLCTEKHTVGEYEVTVTASPSLVDRHGLDPSEWCTWDVLVTGPNGAITLREAMTCDVLVERVYVPFFLKQIVSRARSAFAAPSA